MMEGKSLQEEVELSNKCPSFSIITAAYNADKYLSQCLDSVSSQNYSFVKHTVIDGGSSDKTTDLLNARSDLFYWHSRQDKGIADAFNIGLEHSEGNVILFLGADDCLLDPSVLAECAKFLQQVPRPWFVYGDILYEYDTASRLIKKNYSWRRFKMYDCLPHQAMFLDRCFFDSYGIFDLSYKISMDYEHISRFIRDFSPVYWERTVAMMRRGGVSSDPLPAHLEMDRVKKEHKLAGPVSRYLFMKALWGLFVIKRKLLRQQWS